MSVWLGRESGNATVGRDRKRQLHHCRPFPSPRQSFVRGVRAPGCERSELRRARPRARYSARHDAALFAQGGAACDRPRAAPHPRMGVGRGDLFEVDMDVGRSGCLPQGRGQCAKSIIYGVCAPSRDCPCYTLYEGMAGAVRANQLSHPAQRLLFTFHQFRQTDRKP